jgi:glycosyltransferase involved in cell wall biosynthesis
MLVAVHDPSFWLAPELLGWKLALQLRRTTGFVLGKAAAVLVPSRWTARTLASLYPKAAGRIHVVPLGKTDRFCSRAEPGDSATRDNLRLPDRYILFVGRRQRRKNVDGLVAAYRMAVEMEPKLPPLVLVGPGSREDDQIRRALARWGLRGRVLLHTGVNNDSLPAVYRGADFFCYPSRYEGFGLPLLEAMACGCPVIAADEGALPELVGESGILLPAKEPRAWAETMADVHRDEERKRYLAQLAPDRARGYSWRRTAEATYSQYVAVSAGQCS